MAERRAFLDFEASGLGPSSYPIEIGIAIDSAPGESFSWLILPEAEWVHWDESAEAVHGISREELRIEGRPAFLVARDVNRLLAEYNVYTDGVESDRFWLQRLFDAAGWEPVFHLRGVHELLGVSRSEANRLLGDLERPHRAEADARQLRERIREILAANPS